MSFKRLILSYTLCGGAWAFAGWAAAEFLQGEAGRWFSVALTCGLVGGALGVGLSLFTTPGNASWWSRAKRIAPGLITGVLAGAVGGSLGNLFFNTLHWSRAIGWTVMGAGLGSADGLYERSPARLKRGLIGGAAGGLAGGLLFNAVASLLSTLPGGAGRATAFVMLGGCVGALIGVARVLFADAWLTVIEGDRPGRRLLLDESCGCSGRAEYAAVVLLKPRRERS